MSEVCPYELDISIGKRPRSEIVLGLLLQQRVQAPSDHASLHKLDLGHVFVNLSYVSYTEGSKKGVLICFANNKNKKTPSRVFHHMRGKST